MTGRLLAACTALALAGCQSAEDAAIEKAKARYEFLKDRNATKGEVCEAARAVREAYVAKGDTEGYEEADMYAEIACASAELEGGDLPYRDDEPHHAAQNSTGTSTDAEIDAAAAAAEKAAGDVLSEGSGK